MRRYNSKPENREKKIDRGRRYWGSKKHDLNNKRRSAWAEDPEKYRDRQRQRYQEHRETILSQCSAYKRRKKEADPDRVRAQARAWMRKKYATEKGRLDVRMSALVRSSLKGNKGGRHWETLVGYTVVDLVNRLKSTIPAGYCWDDYISGVLQLDHARPVASFNFVSAGDPDFKECWALSNLQLLTALDNNRKNARWKAA